MKTNNDKPFSLFVAFSLLIHLIALFIFIFGLPSLFRPLPEEKFATIEMLPLAILPNIKNQEKRLEKSLENEESRKTEKINKAEVREEEKLQEKPKEEEKKPEPEKKPDPEPKKEDLVLKKEEETKKTEEPKKEKPVEPKKEVKKKSEEKPKKKKKEIDMDALQKNLEASSEGSKKNSLKKNRQERNEAQSDSKGLYDPNKPLSTTLTLMIGARIKNNLNLAGLESHDLDRVVIYVYLELNMDGSIKRSIVTGRNCANLSKATCDVVEQNTMRAIEKSAPFTDLRQFGYTSWKEFDLEFNPKE